MTAKESDKEMEDLLAEAFSSYIRQYYDGVGVNYSVRVKKNHDNFLIVFVLIKKRLTDLSASTESIIQDREEAFEASWDSINVVQIINETDGSTKYKSKTSVILSYATDSGPKNKWSLMESLCQQSERSILATSDPSVNHIINIGQMVEQAESRLRSDMLDIYVVKARDALHKLSNSGHFAIRMFPTA